MRGQVVRPYALLSTIFTGKEIVAVLTWLLFFGCGASHFCSFPSVNLFYGSRLVAQVVFLSFFCRLVDGRQVETRFRSPLFSVPVYLFCQVVVVSLVVCFTNQLDCNDVFYGRNDLAPFCSVVQVLDARSVEEV